MPVEIPISRGYFVIVDDEDAAWASQYGWSASVKTNTVYARRSWRVGKRKIGTSIHRELLNAPEGMSVDHINGNGLDNRRCNLRICNNSQNHCNRTRLQSNNKSGTTGVFFYEAEQKWIADIKVQGKKIYLGRFKDKDSAVEARKAAEKRYFGEFAPKKEFINGNL